MSSSPDLSSVLAQFSAAFRTAWRAVNLKGRLYQVRLALGRAASQIPHPATRALLSGWLMPRALPVETGDAFGGMEGQLRVSGAHLQPSGEHSSPSLANLRASGEQTAPGASGTRAGPPKRRVQRPGGTFTPAAPARSGPKHSLTGGSKKLSQDEVDAIKHDAVRRKEEAKARAVIDKHRGKFGKFKLEKLAALPRTFAPDALAAFREAHPAVDAATLQLLTPVIAGTSRDVCDRAAVFLRWSEADRQQFQAAFPPESRDRLKPAFEALDRLPAGARQALLRLPRVPVATQVDALATKWATLPKDDIRNVALALAHFQGPELARVIAAPAPPAKIAPRGIRG